MSEERVLVAHASKHGATTQIAERIAAVLRRHGLEVDLMPVGRASNPAGYTAVVLGIAVYMGQWRKEAVKFLTQNEQPLSQRAVWLFTSGPSGEGDPVELLHGIKVPKSRQSLVDRIEPREIRVFHGSLTPKDLSGFERWIINRVKAETGDFRDWKAIEAWADSIAEALAKVS